MEKKIAISVKVSPDFKKMNRLAKKITRLTNETEKAIKELNSLKLTYEIIS